MAKEGSREKSKSILIYAVLVVIFVLVVAYLALYIEPGLKWPTPS